MSARVIDCVLATVIVWEALFCVALVMRLRVKLALALECPSSWLADRLIQIDKILEMQACQIEAEPNTVAETMEVIHQRYADLSETDPKLASELKYRDALALHGK